ncbi:hypothetical protein [Paenibacillus senegalensis]|uniref:hypothetical protein n=1 Tax=Paenibacillus senegalensis TaxID=1465766 RepID=UPI000289FB22|nr:hypothetical protein [Paenibacillus senegalensis]
MENREKGKETEYCPDCDHEGRSDYFMDIDRMVNEGLGGGQVTNHNGLIEETTTDTMNNQETLAANERTGQA